MSSVEIFVPELPEFAVNATIATWHKKPGDSIERDEILVDIETDKVVLEVPSVNSGILESRLVEEGAIVKSNQLLARIKIDNIIKNTNNIKDDTKSVINKNNIQNLDNRNDLLTPAVRRIVSEHNLNPSNIKGTGIKDRLTYKDVNNYLNKHQSHIIKDKSILKQNETLNNNNEFSSHRSEKRIPMTGIRKRIAERLLSAKQNTALLTTFNEVNMQKVCNLRKYYGEIFEKKHDIKLGFMSFYIIAVIKALKSFPEINASIDNSDILYHNYFDISIAVSTPRGLVTPVLRNADTLSIAEIEKNIKELAIKGRDGKLMVEELIGGTFTITNGGIFGSLMSTPIINPPQSAILGMHAIKDRPIVIDGEIKISPMMYLALSYDHRLIDGREAVSFLSIIKNMIEEPIRLLLDV